MLTKRMSTIYFYLSSEPKVSCASNVSWELAHSQEFLNPWIWELDGTYAIDT